ncbi:MAG: ABC transporter ATP-binding protein [Spirochaetales bacterium]|nr:MAG: ABC transporter ATP-binding protein [Spirochaetales bacterium]
MNILTIENLRKTYRTGAEELDVLQGLNLAVEEGTTAAITGESGCGKSTLLNLIAGIDSVSAGIIRCGAFQVEKLSEEELTGYRSGVIGLIFQFHFLLKDFTALENVMIPSFITGAGKAEAEAKAASLLEKVGLSGRTHHYPGQLSGGERQRVAVARALINDPLLILADEPTGNLDENNSLMVQNLLFSLVGELGKTMVLITHDRSFSSRADRVLLLERGTLKSL